MHTLARTLTVAAALAATPCFAEPGRSTPDADRPLKWLIAAQNDDGGWGDGVKTAPDVATTAISALALHRLGHTWSAGAYAASTRKAVEFIVRAVEKTPGNEYAINAPGTLPQRKLGRYIDTFVAAQLLSEVLPTIPKGKDQDRVRAALDICVDKIQAAQRKDGSFSPDGWAPALSTAFASGGLYAARAAGSTHVKAEVLKQADGHMMNSYDNKSKKFATSESAGVELYTMAGTAQAAARQGALGGEAGRAAMDRLHDDNFLRGFGTYGGEEHVSYMMTSEALATVGGADWEKWDHAIRQRLAAIQRQDGTWRGDHCITSTSFCTAASLITLTIHPKAVAKRS
jgi:hypothetical protein